MLRVARHKVGREIDAAGLLSTYDAEHEDGRAVRLRVFNAGLEPDPPVIARFEREAEIASRLRHPSVAAPIAWSATDPVHVSTTPIEGTSLDAVCAAAPAKRLDPAIVVGLGADLADALSAAHAAGLVHAGLSPAVIVLGTDGYAHVTDFALARLLTSMSSAYSHVMRGAIECLAPEQLSAPETVGPATDVFGLGVVLYRALTAKEPFDAPSALGMSIKLSMGKVAPVDSHGVAVPAPLSQLVMKMLGAAPGDRPSMNDVAGALSSMMELRSGPWRDAVRRLAGAGTTSSIAPSAPASAPSSPAPSLGAPPAPLTATPAPFAGPPMSPPFGAPAAQPQRSAPPPAMAPSSAPPGPALAPAPFGAPAPSFGGSPSFGAPAPSFGAPPPSFGAPSFAARSFSPPAAPSPIAPGIDEADMRPTIADAGPLVPEDELPDYLRDDPGGTEVLAVYDEREEETSVAVPKTVVMRDPRAPSLEAASAAPWALQAAKPQPVIQPQPSLPPAPLAPPPREGLPDWAIWAAVGTGALALFGTTVILVILIVS